MSFIVFSGRRTGSHFLGTLLNSHPDILCDIELMNRHFMKYDKFFTRNNLLEEILNNNNNKTFIKHRKSYDFYDSDAFIKEKNNFKVFGFLLKYWYKEFNINSLDIDLLKKFKYLHLIRKDPVSMGFSCIILEHMKDHYHFSKEEKPDHKILFNLKEIEKVKTVINRYVRDIKNKRKSLLNFDTKEVFYEDLHKDFNSNGMKLSDELSKDICSFLEVDTVNLTTKLIKNKYYQPKEIIKNYEEVLKNLKKTYKKNNKIIECIEKIK